MRGMRCVSGMRNVAKRSDTRLLLYAVLYFSLSRAIVNRNRTPEQVGLPKLPLSPESADVLHPHHHTKIPLSVDDILLHTGQCHTLEKRLAGLHTFVLVEITGPGKFRHEYGCPLGATSCRSLDHNAQSIASQIYLSSITVHFA